MNGGDDQMGAWDQISSFGEERQEGDKVVSVVMGLVVQDYTWRVWWTARWRHVLTRWCKAIADLSLPSHPLLEARN